MDYQGNSGIFGFRACLQIAGRLLEAFNRLDAVIILIDLDGKIRFFNEKAPALYKYTDEQMTGLDFSKLGAETSSYNGNTVKKWLTTVQDSGQLSVEWLSRDKLGRHFWVSVSFTKVSEAWPMTLALITDGGKLKMIQAEREAYERKYQALINAMPDVIFHVDNNTKILSCSVPHADKLIKPADQLVGRCFYDIMPLRLANEFFMKIMLVLGNREPQVLEYAMPLMGKRTYHEARIVYLDFREVLLICRDITERKQHEHELRYMSYHDALTGLHNRAFFESEAIKAIANKRFPLALIVCDVDGLKITNDNLGHEVGDRLLMAAAKVLRESVPDNVILSRIGGDEFVVLMLNVSKEEVYETYRCIHQEIKEYNKRESNLYLSISMGYAIANGATHNIKELFKEADDNMYKTKTRRKRKACSDWHHEYGFNDA